MSIFKEIEAELGRARSKFPSNEHLLAALMEEVGELATAYLEDEGPERVRAEAVQVATVAIRLATEGDGDYGDADEIGEPCGIRSCTARVGRFEGYDGPTGVTYCKRHGESERRGVIERHGWSEELAQSVIRPRCAARSNGEREAVEWLEVPSE